MTKGASQRNGDSGGTGETLSQLCTISGKPRLRGAAEPLSDWNRC